MERLRQQGADRVYHCPAPLGTAVHRVHPRCAYREEDTDHIGVDSRPPRTTPARGPPLWDECDGALEPGEHVDAHAAAADAHPEWDPSSAQPSSRSAHPLVTW